MIITTTYQAESKKDATALRYMAISMKDAGMDVELNDAPELGGVGLELSVKESRRSRRSSQQVAEDALTAGETHL